MAIPIWKDKYVDLGSYDSVNFRIKVGSTNGDTIYSGRAFRKPGASTITVRINDICADYLHNMSESVDTTLTYPLSFYVQKNVSGPVWTSVETVQFINDWSYDYAYNPSTMGMVAPINGHIDQRQYIPFTAITSVLGYATIRYKNGGVTRPSLSRVTPADSFTRSLYVAGGGSALLDLSLYSNVASVEMGNKKWTVVTDCAEWVLYYTNAYGGWDALLIEGTTLEHDELKRTTIDADYDNNSIRNRGRINVATEISKRYTLNTSWLSDDEASRMHHLLNSTDVYLCNIGSGEIMPVTLSNTTTEYKTYKTNGAKLVNYTIDVEVAQERVRK